MGIITTLYQINSIYLIFKKSKNEEITFYKLFWYKYKRRIAKKNKKKKQLKKSIKEK